MDVKAVKCLTHCNFQISSSDCRRARGRYIITILKAATGSESCWVDGAVSYGRVLTSWWQELEWALTKQKKTYMRFSCDIPLFSLDLERKTRIKVNSLSYSRLDVSFLKFIQPAYKCQDGALLGGTLWVTIYHILILQMRKLRFKERKWFAPIAELGRNWD